MRNSEAQRYARWSLAAAGLLAAVVAGVYVRNVWVARQAEKKAPPAVPPTVEQRSNEFSFSKVEGQRTIYTVRASRATEFKEGGRSLLEDVDIAVYGKKGERNDTLRTRACDFISKTGKISCAGEVQFSLRAAGAAQVDARAIQVATSAITFDRDSGAARSDKPLTFEWPSGKGRGVGVNYDSNSGTLSLAHAVELTLSSPAPTLPEKTTDATDTTGATGEKAAHVSGNSMVFQREARAVLLKGDVLARQATHELSAQRLLLRLDAAFHAKLMVAGGHPQLHDLISQSPLALSADEMVSALRPDGSIESIAASGHVHGTRNTPVGGDAIDAGRIQMDFAGRNNAPQLMTASKGVTLASTSASQQGGTRHVASDALEIHFSSGSGLGLGQNTLESVNTLAPARVDWQNVSIVKGKPVPQTMRMAGNRIRLKFQARNLLQELVSTGSVTVTRKLGDAPDETTTSRELNAKFDGAGEWTAIDQTGDVHFTDGQRTGQGDRAHVERATNGVTLDGNVVFADAATRTTAQSASFDRAANTLRAEGHVLTTELRPAVASISNLAQEPAHISAEHLVVDTARGHAVYSGKGRLWQGPSVIEGDTIELDNPTHSLVAKGQVHGVFPQAAWNSRPADAAGPQLGSVRGGLLTYWEGESRARIEQGAEVDTEQGSIQADRIDLYFSDAGAANGTKQLSRADANGNVVVRQEDRRGTSGRAEYTASEGKFVLSQGNPMLYSSTGDTTTGRQLTFFFADDRIVVDSADGSKTVTLHQVEK